MHARLPIVASASRSFTGTQRASNQDRFVVDQELGFALLADGVAGRPAGARAAEVAIQAASLQLQLVLVNGHCKDALHARQLLGDAFRFADITVQSRAVGDLASTNMASTLVGAVFIHGHVAIANLGNSRVYRLRDAALELMTDDHLRRREGLSTLSPDEVIALRPLQVLSRAIGHQAPGNPDIRIEPLLADDVFLLCSNGLSDVLDKRRMEELMLQASGLDQACELLLSTAVELGAEDDVTVVLVQPEYPGVLVNGDTAAS